MQMARPLAAMMLVMMASACTPCALREPGEQWKETTLFFGLSRQDGSVLTTEEWDGFAKELTTAFPDGLTILQADGLYLETRSTPPKRTATCRRRRSSST